MYALTVFVFLYEMHNPFLCLHPFPRVSTVISSGVKGEKCVGFVFCAASQTHLDLHKLLFVVVDEVLVGLPVHRPQLNHLQQPVTRRQTQTVITTAVTQGDVTLVQLVCG